MRQTSSPCSWDLPAFAAAADGLAAHPPYKVPLSRLQVVFHHATIADAQLLQALNGAVVALTKPAEKPQHKGMGTNAAAAAAPNAPSACLGLGIVRSVDPDKQLLYILTTTPLEHLQKATTLEVWHPRPALPMCQVTTCCNLLPFHV